MKKKKKVLILSVGGTEKPLILAINSFKPDLVYFIHSKETEKTIETILSELETLKYKTKLIENPQDLRESFDAAKAVLFELVFAPIIPIKAVTHVPTLAPKVINNPFLISITCC